MKTLRGGSQTFKLKSSFKTFYFIVVVKYRNIQPGYGIAELRSAIP